MTEECNCARALESCPTASPFGKIIVVDWYDGPVSGAALCEAERHAYSFHMLSWDNKQGQRIFSLSSLPLTSFEALEELFAAAEDPKWPVWWPAEIEEQDRAAAEWREANEILESGEAPGYIVSSRDLASTLDECRRLEGAEDLARIEALTAAKAAHDEWLTLFDKTGASGG